MSQSEVKPKKLAVVEHVTELAMRLSGRHLADYGATRSRHDFTQRQLMSCLILRAYLKTTYRGLLDLLAASPGLRERMGLTEKLPHFTTLQKFSGRSKVLEIAQRIIASIGGQVGKGASDSTAAMDSTGLALTTASDYYRSRKGGKVRKWVKVSVMVWCSSLLPLSLVVDFGPSNDRVQGKELLTQAQAVAKPSKLYADAGYDSEPLHEQCRDQWGVPSVIKPIERRADGKRGGKWRAQMSADYLKTEGYGRRWAVETFFSAFKRTMGGALLARKPKQMIAEATFRVLAYVLRR
jgi:hypothetical protein